MSLHILTLIYSYRGYSAHYAETMIKECVHNALKLCSASDSCVVTNITCEKHATKHDFYSSYYVTVSVFFHDSINGLMSSEVWPSGLLACRFFKKK